MLVSVVIPTLNEGENIAQTIRTARRHYPSSEVEIIVVDGGSQDGTPQLVPADAKLVFSRPGRAVQMNAGARTSSGEVLVFCHADTQLPSGWRGAVIRALAQPGASGGAFQIECVPAFGVFYLLNRLWLPPNWRLMFGDQAQFMPRGIFEDLGGFPEIPLMEDLEMARRLHNAGCLVRPPLRVSTSSRRFQERGAIRQLLLDAWLWARYLYFGASPQELARYYKPHGG
ncbi:MAG TPA: TIGR04283 family arsenosugar biosynthesis glycosyltransferase [Anaerolineales bacterium]|nr:TIGR04283 family arsenosugar biosynthesis glycosyltransferase [Anaerolineales bacterium]